MNVLMTLVLAVQMLTALGMIGLILLQHGKGADMGAAFGSGASGSLFGATGSANFLSRSTAICATVFFVTTIGMGMLSTGRFASVHPTTSVNRGPRRAATRAANGDVTIMARPPGAIHNPVCNRDWPSPYPVSGDISRI